MLVVISILGILAALTVPALKNLGKSNVQVSASRQILDDVARARQLAISQRTTVYMMFVPAAFWLPPLTASSAWTNSLSPAEYTNVINLLDKQLTGYAFVSLRSVGDQPGQGVPQYLSEWKLLPDGSFIATNKFYNNTFIYDYSFSPAVAYPVSQFNYTASLPFPTEANVPAGILLPYIAFNYMGQLTVDGVNLAPRDEYIPLAQGSPLYAMNSSKALQFLPATFDESPPGNSTNSMFNVIHIDRLTGRAGLLKQKVQ